MTRSILVRLANIVGAVVSLILVAFVLFQSFNALDTQGQQLLSPANLGWFAGALILTTLSALVLPRAYGFILLCLSAKTNPELRFIRAIYASTQIYKYLPGNVFHFVGRQMAIRKLGIPDGAIANASVVEMLALGFIAGVCILLTGNTALVDLVEALGLNDRQWMYLALAGSAAIGASLLVFWYLRRSGIRFRGSDLIWIILYYLAYFLLAALGLLFILNGLGLAGGEFATMVIIFCTSWILGTAMPGASAGIGVREAVIVAMGTYLLDQNLALAALVLRVLTVAADAIVWLLGFSCVHSGQKRGRPG